MIEHTLHSPDFSPKKAAMCFFKNCADNSLIIDSCNGIEHFIVSMMFKP